MGNAQDGTLEELQSVFAASGYRKSMGLRIVEGNLEQATIECEVKPEFANTQGVAHGGLISGLIDTAAGVAAKCAMGRPRAAVATVALTINYHLPGRVGQTLRAVGRRVSGRGTLCCQVEVHDGEGSHVATGIATLRMPRQDPAG